MVGSMQNSKVTNLCDALAYIVPLTLIQNTFELKAAIDVFFTRDDVMLNAASIFTWRSTVKAVLPSILVPVISGIG